MTGQHLPVNVAALLRANDRLRARRARTAGRLRALRAENARLRAALTRYTDIVLLDAKTYTARYGVTTYADAMDEVYRAARAALLGQEPEP